MPEPTPPAGEDHDDGETSTPQFPGLARPEGQLYDMPVKYRWEVTRRHPYYIEWWNFLSRMGQTLSPEEIDSVHSWYSMLTRIGVSRADYSPCAKFHDIDLSGPIQGWLVGGIQLQSYRQLVGILLGTLPPDGLETVGRLLIQASQNPDEGRLNALFQLANLKDDKFNKHTGHPIVRISPTLSANTLSEDVKQFLEEWRGPQSSERRLRTDKYDDYLAVWDLHEGWQAGEYCVRMESPFSKIAQVMGISTSTVFNQYRSAFELISGHPYSLANWIQLFGSSKWKHSEAEAFAKAVAKRRAGLPRASESAAIPMASTDRSNRYNLRAGSKEISSDIAVSSLLNDIVKLISTGRSDDEICDELELKNPSLVAAIRQRTELAKVNGSTDLQK